MLSNAYFLAKFRFDTAENEPAKNLQIFRKMHFSKMQPGLAPPRLANCRFQGRIESSPGLSLPINTPPRRPADFEKTASTLACSFPRRVAAASRAQIFATS